MKRVIVFGATGNLGANISIYLHNIGYEVIAVGHRKNDNGHMMLELIKQI